MARNLKPQGTMSDSRTAAPEQDSRLSVLEAHRRVSGPPNPGLHHPALSLPGPDLYYNFVASDPENDALPRQSSSNPRWSSSVPGYISDGGQTVFSDTVVDHSVPPSSSPSVLLAANSSNNLNPLSTHPTRVGAATYPSLGVSGSSLSMETTSYGTANLFSSQQFPAFPQCSSIYSHVAEVSSDTMTYPPEGWIEYTHDAMDRALAVPDELCDTFNSLSTSQAGYMTTTTAATFAPTYYALEPWLAGSAGSYLMQQNSSNNTCSSPTTPPYQDLQVECALAHGSRGTSVSDFSGYDSSFDPPVAAATIAAAVIPIADSTTPSTTTTTTTTQAQGQGFGQEPQRQRRPRRRRHPGSSSPAATTRTTSASLEAATTAAAASNNLHNIGIPTGTDGTWRCAHPGCASQAIFRRGCDLRKHFNRHRKHLFCRHEGCPQATQAGFSSQKDRARHEAKHNPGVLCEWENCARVFSRVDNMKDHVRRIHQRRG